MADRIQQCMIVTHFFHWAIHTTLYRVCSIEYTWLFVSAQFFAVLQKNTFGIRNTQYEGCLLYFGIKEQKQILIIENCFIVFQNIPH